MNDDLTTNMPLTAAIARLAGALTDAQIDDACRSRYHDFGLMSAEEKNKLRWAAADWWLCLSRALAPAQAGVGGWQPIATAPKGDKKRDGPTVLIWGGVFWDEGDTYPTEYPLTEPVLASFSHYGGWVIERSETHGCNVVAKPTDWMPRPAPPTSTGGEP